MICCTELKVIEDFYAVADCERIYHRLLQEQN